LRIPKSITISPEKPIYLLYKESKKNKFGSSNYANGGSNGHGNYLNALSGLTNIYQRKFFALANGDNYKINSKFSGSKKNKMNNIDH
jgi:hypothetical protein